MSLAVLCPSRNNPIALMQAASAFGATQTGPDTFFVGVVDFDDPMLQDYVERAEADGVLLMQTPPGSVGSMNSAMNWAAERWAQQVDIVGFIGDDHRFRTKGWDHIVEMVLKGQGGGLAYGDDLAQRERLPTQVFISSFIVRALGWMGLPGAKHLYLDNTWLVLGSEADCLYYIPDVVIEHIHPAYGKTEWDENHLRVNSQAMYDHDRTVFETWMTTQREDDVQRVRQSITSATAG